MKIKVETSFLRPIKLEENEWVDVTLPDGRQVTVFHDKVYVRNAADVKSGSDGKLVWLA